MTTAALTLSHQNWLTPSTDIDQYIAKVRQIPALDADEERRLAIALQETNDINAAQTLIVHHLIRRPYRTRLYRLRPTARRPHPGRQHRSDESRQTL